MSHSHIFKFIFTIALIEQCFICDTNALQQNRTFHHVRRSSMDDSFFKNQKPPSYRSFQPVSIKYRKSYPREDRTDYDITSYDSEYGGVVSNFTSSIYDDNPPLYPNPEILSRSNQVSQIIHTPLGFKLILKAEGSTDSQLTFERSPGSASYLQDTLITTVSKSVDTRVMDSEVDLPDDSLADADLKEHNIIDSVTYLYGFNNCHGVRNEWKILIFITSGLAVLMLVGTVMWLLWSEYAAEFRRSSKLYPININLCCCLVACTLIYIQAVMGVSSPAQCERVALLLHYTHVCCAMWIAALAAAVAEYCACDSLLPLKYNYLLAYGVPAIVVMFNYALSMEHYEIKHYCWMSIEKGMVMGFMAPAMILILVNTGISIVGLQSVNRKQAEMLTAKIQELVDHHLANWPTNEQRNSTGSIDTLDNMYSPSSSRKNTDTSDKDYNMSEDDCQYVNLGNSNGEFDLDCENQPAYIKALQDRGLLNILYSMDNLSLKWSWNTEGNELKSYLNLCLVLEPFFAINWVMGVVAIENAGHWSTPTIYLILVVAMYVYLTATLCTTLPIVRHKATAPCCEEVVTGAAMPRSRTTDSIPLLDPAIQQPIVTPAPADTISTISI